MKRQNIQASLNLSDPFEKELYDFALKQGKTSSYIKRLIYLDKMNKEANITPQPTVTIPAQVDKKQAAMQSIL
jgi:hypothetical protein